jgi:hypothetical protein
MKATDNYMDIAQTVSVTGRSKKTIERYLKKGKFPSAYKDKATKKWYIATFDLVHLGLDEVTTPPTDTTDTHGQNNENELHHLLEMKDLENKMLKQRIADLERNIYDLRGAVKQIEYYQKRSFFDRFRKVKNNTETETNKNEPET